VDRLEDISSGFLQVNRIYNTGYWAVDFMKDFLEGLLQGSERYEIRKCNGE